MGPQRPSAPVAPVRHLVAAAETGDGARFATLLAEASAPVRVRPLTDGVFHSAVRSAAAGDVRVSVVSGSPCTVTRGLDLIATGDPGVLVVALPRTGRAEVEQDGRRCLVGPGGLVNYVTSRPYEVTFREAYEMVVVSIPLTALGAHADTLAGRTAVAVTTDTGPRDVVATLFGTLAAKIDGCTAGEASCSTEYLADAIVSLAIAELVDIPPQGAGDDLADRVLAHCLAHLSDPGLTVESVARAHAVSVRYLHKVLAPREITLSAWIRTQRLERICRDLADESLRGRTASAVAARWGLTDARHLSRALRAEFGTTATEIRRSGRRAAG
ncbi:helix-turn-helix domain-containing protein [Pseudonocardia sp. KRD-184]|uniref:Helix-turn-helix domain-containing protein n=1 Tax=Pseudonocardia oceani TaxID=2792013 RepID=A0ABS6U2T1_9PSEU|nr:helix-turn-helix domain-containing protein [Pseudonocardia oceani]MBW0089418.1 helix-turn-helix domain-containing protein [Pseudonocardia oceani]MBW0096424.1 helix-turn-helix domain-containing protein [Pseudonocardia oceani]MBW0109126.1 helix-turn-helix domain-containing protein [Pseudonocardia oceani]MBW0122425.1 helix-turn-helix domain-containing protein [Pseudonocardia oceani]MBW0126224.1 helix-turn-helix domain-containing protein [Pseudonocardia oceani]